MKAGPVPRYHGNKARFCPHSLLAWALLEVRPICQFGSNPVAGSLGLGALVSAIPACSFAPRAAQPSVQKTGRVILRSQKVERRVRNASGKGFVLLGGEELSC